jgi:hypothetical protein
MTMLALPLLAAAGVPACVAVDVKPGVVLDQSTADDAKNLLPPEIYNHYKKGEYTNRVVDFPDSKFQWDDGYRQRASGTGSTSPSARASSRSTRRPGSARST